MSLDSARDYLCVGNQSVGVQVFHDASIANEPNAATNPPDRTISTADIGTTLRVRDIALDPVRDILYVAVDSFVGTPTMSILVFANASGLNATNLTPDRTITITTNNFGTMALFIDTARDWLYFADSGSILGGGISIIDNASNANGPPVSGRSILLPSPILRLVVDTVNDRLYAAGSSALYIVPGISTVAPGSVNATAALAGPGSSFTAVAVRP